MLLEDIKDTIPKGPGVYIFEKNEMPLYIGKSKSIYKRILQHFNSSAKSLRFITKADKLSFLETAGEFGALVREARLIKKLYPVYNRQLRRLKTVLTVKLVKDEEDFLYPTILNKDVLFDPDIVSDTYVFTSIRELDGFLENLSYDKGICRIKLKLEKGKFCFLSQLGKCSGACSNKQTSNDFNKILKKNFGKFKVNKWKFKEEKVINEKYEGLEETFTIHNWKIMNLENNFSFEDSIMKTFETSLDEYKIINKFL